MERCERVQHVPGNDSDFGLVRITGWDVQYIRARGHECLCVRARARVWISPCGYIGYIAIDGSDIYRQMDAFVMNRR